MTFRIRDAEPRDAPALVDLIRGLAAFERLEHEVVASAEKLARHLRADASPRCHAVLCETGAGEPVGFALYYWSYSTFLTDWGIYLEDLFVREPFRGKGLGLALLARLAHTVRVRGGTRLTWQVLDWNPARAFYESLGARTLEDWQTMRLDGAALDAVAARWPDAQRRVEES